MTAPHSRPAANLRRLDDLVIRWIREQRALVIISTMAWVCFLAAFLWPEIVPANLLILPLVLGPMYLVPRQLPGLVAFVIGLMLVAVSRVPMLTPRIVVGALIILVTGAFMLVTSRRRGRLGVGGAQGERMFIDLRDRIQRQAMVPELPAGWCVEVAVRTADGTGFAGDFALGSMSPDGSRCYLVVVDVSGKGIEAGTRALQMSGAFGALLGALPAEQFLPAANDYLLRQGWLEGFATAVYLTLDLTDGAFQIWNAGHPPAVQLDAASGQWLVHETATGPALGLMPQAEFCPVTGVLRVGDALLLYTDGVVESRRRDLTAGIDRLAGNAERLRGDFAHGAEKLVDSSGTVDDDRALVLIHRLGVPASVVAP